MARKLTETFVATITRPGKYGDGHGLSLRVCPSGSKQWIWRGTVLGKRVDRGLGGYPAISLAMARQTAREYRKLARAGKDPRTLRGRVPTFAEAAEMVIAIRRGSWRPGGKTEAEWRASLRDYAMPILGEKGVGEVTSADVLASLRAVWTTKPETGRRVRRRIEAVMKWAVAHGYREDNPAGNVLDAALPQKPRHQKRIHPPTQASSGTAAETQKFIESARRVLRTNRLGIRDEDNVLAVMTMAVRLIPTKEDERAEEEAMGLLYHPERWATLVELAQTCYTSRKILEVLLDRAGSIVRGEDIFPSLADRRAFDEGYELLKDWAARSGLGRDEPDGRGRYRAHTHVFRNRAIVAGIGRIAKLRRQKGIRFQMTSREGKLGTSLVHDVASHLSRNLPVRKGNSDFPSYSALHRIWCNREYNVPSQEIDDLWQLMENLVKSAAVVAVEASSQGIDFDVRALRWCSTHESLPLQPNPAKPAADLPETGGFVPKRGENRDRSRASDPDSGNDPTQEDRHDEEDAQFLDVLVATEEIADTIGRNIETPPLIRFPAHGPGKPR